jgi:hypothetical protein
MMSQLFFGRRIVREAPPQSVYMQSVRFSFAVIWFACAGIASAAPVPFDGKVDIGGRSIRIGCLGKGTPSVIVETGLSASATNNAAWRTIALRVAPATQICLYDRAGRSTVQ